VTNRIHVRLLSLLALVGCDSYGSHHYRCVDGVCTLVCEGGYGNCSGDKVCETDLTNDDANCGACGRRCLSGTRCTGGACAPICTAGRGDCDLNYANGCETDLTTDRNHCGACRAACVWSICRNGECVCPPGQVMCAPTICFDLQTTPLACGACGNVCARGQSCVKGRCM
jgi:hypothetical protein